MSKIVYIRKILEKEKNQWKKLATKNYNVAAKILGLVASWLPSRADFFQNIFSRQIQDYYFIWIF
jgi:hypothetical protein